MNKNLLKFIGYVFLTCLAIFAIWARFQIGQDLWKAGVSAAFGLWFAYEAWKLARKE